MEKHITGKMEQLSFDSLLEDDSSTTNEIESDENAKIQTMKQNRKTFPIHLIIDFDTFMNYIEHHPIQLTKTKEHLAKKHLPSINEKLSIKEEDATSNTQQEYYPYIHFFYHLALHGQLMEKVSIQSGKLQLRFTERWNMYKDLTDTEKYFFLLETFWVDVNWARLLDKHDNPVHHILPEIFTRLCDEKSGFCLSLDKEPLLSRLTFQWNYFFLYLEWFGIWICEKNQEQMDHYGKKLYYFAKTITLATFGKKVVPILLQSRNLHAWNISLRREFGEVNPLPGSALPELEDESARKKQRSNRNDPQPFYQAFTDLFPKRELQSTLPRLERKLTSGAHSLKVVLNGKVWRRVVLSGKHTMEDLHYIILQAFQFDDDHLYSFFMDGKKWSRDCIVSPINDTGGQSAARVAIGSIGLHPGQRFLYLYDYGDEWLFTITVDQIQDTDTEIVKPYIAERKGAAPEQYD